MEKNPKSVPTITLDGIEPLTQEEITKLMTAAIDSDCFGKEWDMTVRPCQVCADNEVCGILFAEVVKTKVAEVEQKHVAMLDKADLSLIDDEEIFNLMVTGNGTMTVEELLSILKAVSGLDDDIALVEWVKRFRERCGKGFSIKAGIIHVNNTWIR